jgi:hypothetical protein
MSEELREARRSMASKSPINEKPIRDRAKPGGARFGDNFIGVVRRGGKVVARPQEAERKEPVKG